MGNRRVRRWGEMAVLGLVVVLVMLVAIFAGISLLIGSGVRQAAEIAMTEHRGDRVEALIAYVDSAEHPLHLRNRAVWALGQLGDTRALPVLERHATGRSCDHSRLLCQKELGKAIRLCRGAGNIGAIMWR